MQSFMISRYEINEILILGIPVILGILEILGILGDLRYTGRFEVYLNSFSPLIEPNQSQFLP